MSSSSSLRFDNLASDATTPKRSKTSSAPTADSYLPDIRNPFLGGTGVYLARAVALIASQPNLQLEFATSSSKTKTTPNTKSPKKGRYVDEADSDTGEAEDEFVAQSDTDSSATDNGERSDEEMVERKDDNKMRDTIFTPSKKFEIVIWPKNELRSDIPLLTPGLGNVRRSSREKRTRQEQNVSQRKREVSVEL